MASTEEQIGAWETYRLAKLKADKTLAFDDGKAAVKAWLVFADLFRGDTQISQEHIVRNNVTPFPVHKSRAPGCRA